MNSSGMEKKIGEKKMWDGLAPIFFSLIFLSTTHSFV
jgi:hypothetical protein